MVSREDKKYIEIARKYGLRLGTVKIEVFRLFDEGCSPAEVGYLLRYLIVDRSDARRFSNNIRRYYWIWKEAQAPKG